MKEYFATTEQAGAWLRVSVCTVQRLTSSVRIQSTKLGAARLFRGSDLLRPIGAPEASARTPLLTLEGAAARLGLTAPACLETCVDRGEVPALRLGRMLRCDPAQSLVPEAVA
jgi:hypothetical protein